MCEMCDGKTLDEVLEGMHDRVHRYGFTMTGIEPSLDQPSWLYTVGLADTPAHPELSILGVPPPWGYIVLDDVAKRVLAGERFEADVDLEVRGLVFHVSEIDARLWDGPTFNQWNNYYAWRAHTFDQAYPTPSGLELQPCGSQRHPWESAAQELSSPSPPRNRAERRARGRHLRALR